MRKGCGSLIESCRRLCPLQAGRSLALNSLRSVTPGRDTVGSSPAALASARQPRRATASTFMLPTVQDGAQMSVRRQTHYVAVPPTMRQGKRDMLAWRQYG